MSSNVMKEYMAVQDKKRQQDYSSDVIAFISKAGIGDTLNHDFAKIVKHTTMSMKNMACAYYKAGTFLDVADIEQIKVSLNNFTVDDLKVCQFKAELVSDLTGIQKKIESKHAEKLRKMVEEKTMYERQIKVLDFAKNKLIMDRLSKIQWPYDSKTQEFDAKISGLNARVENLSRRLEEAKKMRPSADEKDILIYQMEIREKYSNKC